MDVWAIEQIFPIMPIHRLDEEPRESTTLSDITCDSDGKFDRFISSGIRFSHTHSCPILNQILPMFLPKKGHAY